MELRLASDDEKRARDALTHAEWGQKLTVPQYLDREKRLRAHAWSRAAMRTWLLVEGSEVLASCETFAMRAFLENGHMQPGLVDGVASVFVEPRLRGKQYASALMGRLVSRLGEEGRFASILYSDVGSALYERAGFAARPAIERIFAAEPGNPANACDRVFRETDFERELAVAPRPPDRLLIWPEAVQLDWHLERERIYAGFLGRERPAIHGAAAGSARIFWTADYKSERLMILTLAATQADEALALLQASRRAAHAAGLAQVVIWECAWPFELADDAGGGRLHRRAESLPMLCPVRPGVDPHWWGQTSRATWI